MFLSPPLVLSMLIASIYAFLFHLVWGRSVRELVFYWLVGVVGFGLGQIVSRFWPVDILRIGQVHLLEGSIVCWVFLFIAKWLKM